MPYAIATAAAPTVGTAPVAQAITVNCGGLTPKAVIVIATRATALNTITNGAMHSIGITDGTTTRVQASMAEDATTASIADTGVAAGTPLIRILDTADETVIGEATFVSFAADTLNISWNPRPGSAFQIEVIAFYGPNMQVAVGVLTLNLTLNATTTASGLAFRPAGLFHLGSYGNFGAGGNGATARMSCGFVGFNSDGTVQGQAGFTARQADRATPTACISAIRDDATALRSTISAEDGKFSVTSGTSDGFVVTCLSNPAQAYAFAYLAFFTGGRISVGVVQPATSSSGAKTISSIKGKTDFVLALGTGLSTKNSYATAEPCSNWSFGANLLGGAMGSISFSDSDAAVTSESRCATSDNALVGAIVSTTADWSATFTASAAESSYGAGDGTWTLTVGTASPADRYLAYMAFETPLVIASDTEQTSDNAAINVGLATSDTEQLSDQGALNVGLATSDTEQITDQTALNVLMALSETEQLSDQSAINVGLATSDTEQISDQTALNVLMALSDTEEITDSPIVFVNAYIVIPTDTVEIDDRTVLSSDLSVHVDIVVSDFEQISDQAAEVWAMVLSETEQLLEDIQVPGVATIVLSDIEQITETDFTFLGRIIVTDDTEQITEEIPTRLMVTSGKGTMRGTTLQGGAEAGWTYQAGSERGGTLDG